MPEAISLARDQSSVEELTSTLILPEPRVSPPLDPDFRPAALANRAYREAVAASGQAVPCGIAVERSDGLVSVYRTEVFADLSGGTLAYVERIVKMLLWARGGWRVVIDGPEGVADYLRQAYSESGARAFDAEFMGDLYEHPFTVEHVAPGALPARHESVAAIGGHLKGCRIGFDAGASDHKVAAVIDGEEVWSQETVWNPKLEADPEYHFEQIVGAMRAAGEHMPRVDAIGVSSAGIYINDLTMVASLFRAVPKEIYKEKVRPIYLRAAAAIGADIPVAVLNDGDVTALAGAMNLGDNAVLGIAMGSSEAGGYVDPDGKITGWLNELAFVPIDYRPHGPTDEWSGDQGVGVEYLCQMGVIRVATQAGIDLSAYATPAEKLKAMQKLHSAGDETAAKVFESIGVFLGYAIAHYADFYPIRHVLILGRVTSGEGGPACKRMAQRVLDEEFPELAKQITLHLPEDDKLRRVGQAVAAASLPAGKA